MSMMWAGARLTQMLAMSTAAILPTASTMIFAELRRCYASLRFRRVRRRKSKLMWQAC
jgi:hypothetical protein